jgi:hypothetical protein
MMVVKTTPNIAFPNLKRGLSTISTGRALRVLYILTVSAELFCNKGKHEHIVFSNFTNS